MSEPDFRQMGDPLNDRLPPLSRHPTRRSREQWLKAGAPNYPTPDDSDWDFLVKLADLLTDCENWGCAPNERYAEALR